MRIPIFKVCNDDDPMDYAFPRAVAWPDLVDSGDTETVNAVLLLPLGQCVTVGGGAGVQFTIERIR